MQDIKFLSIQEVLKMSYEDDPYDVPDSFDPDEEDTYDEEDGEHFDEDDTA